MNDLFSRRKLINNAMFTLTGVFTFFSLFSLFLILGYITYHGISSLNWNFFTKIPVPLGETGGGIANSIVGSAKVLGLACVFGIPIGVFGAVYLSEFGNNRIGFCIRYCADVLNGVPSIVMGIFAYTLVVLPMKGFSALSGSVALGIIMIPLVLRTTEEFIRLVPGSIREAALALGVPQWKVILRVVLPTASRGIMTGAILAVSRIAGETAPLIFTAFGNRFWDDGLLHPIATLPHTIFTYAIAPYDDWHRQAWAAALVLMAVVLIGNIGARVLMRSKGSASH
ncbi:MAG: Phosphate transport system permease protein PstA [Elusimicrobia bacterium]|nr:Phosphate transport system permease protein PstA [Elusimicrobiota bacterium]